jgi:hypothetical protein
MRETYIASYDARVSYFPKNIVVLAKSPADIYCAAGLRECCEDFFSECYIDCPIEQALGAVSRTFVGRHEIVEVSGLASRSPSLSAFFMKELILYIEELGFNWAFFTATSRLEKLLKRMRLPMIELGAASASRVSSPEVWGSYYQTNPKVFAIGREHLSRFLAVSRAAHIPMSAPTHG